VVVKAPAQMSPWATRVPTSSQYRSAPGYDLRRHQRGFPPAGGYNVLNHVRSILGTDAPKATFSGEASDTIEIGTNIPEIDCKSVYNDSAMLLFNSELAVRIPMMSISHSDLMPIRAERSDAGLSQCETVIGIRQEFWRFSLPWGAGEAARFRCFVFGR
jgi:hypothetical protein